MDKQQTDTPVPNNDLIPVYYQQPVPFTGASYRVHTISEPPTIEAARQLTHEGRGRVAVLSTPLQRAWLDIIQRPPHR